MPSFSIRRPWSPARRLTRNTRWALGGVALGLLVSALILVLFRCPDEGAQVIFGLLVMGTIALAVLGAVSFFLSRHVSALLLGACLGLVTAFILIFLVFAQYIPGC